MSGVAGNLVAAPLLARAAQPSRARAGAARAPLATLAANTARNLGPYANPAIAQGATAITDFSGIAYDPVAGRMCLFGGGHGSSQETDIRVLDMASLEWSSLYPTTPAAQMTTSNGDRSYGRWISTNHPYARHTYNLSLVWQRRFYLMSPWGMPDGPDGPTPPRGGRLCWYEFDTGQWSYSRYRADAAPVVPWYFAAAAAVDPRSGNIIVAGPNEYAGMGSVWVYDPAADRIVETSIAVDVGGEPDLVYFPGTDRFYVLQGDGRVWELALDRAAPSRTTIEPVAVRGTPPASARGTRCGFACDPVNGVIGGNVERGVFHAFDPQSKTWTASAMQVEAGSSGVPDQAFHCLEFDPSSGCFVFLQNGADASGANRIATTWAYRPASARPRQVADLSMRLDFGEQRVATFSGANAEDAGDFIGEHVRLQCFLATDARFPDWRVWFRVDVDRDGRRLTGTDGRDEAIVEYGSSDGRQPAHWLTPYVATFAKGGATLATYRVPRHAWYARWRHQSSRRPVVRTPATLRARGLVPAFGRAGTFGRAPNTRSVAWEGPMSAPQRAAPDYPFDPAMGSGGDNPQIGYLTEFAADYVINGSAESLQSVRTEGEWCANWCTHVRDATGGMPDVREPRLDWKSNGGTLDDAPPVVPATQPGFVAVEVAHWYPCANLPWLLTEDPYFLEELQFGANWQILYDYTPRIREALPGLVDPFQTRAYAWGLRDLFLLAASCPENVPRWLQPRRYWRACVEDNRVFAMRFVDSPARIHALFRTWTRSDADAAWQSAWLSAVVGIAIGQGFGDWEPVFAWSIDKQIQQTNGTSGWPRQWPVPYYSFPNRGGEKMVLFPYRDRSPDATTCVSWADYWAYYAAGSDGRSDGTGRTLDPAVFDPQRLEQQFHEVGPSYFLHLRSALAVAVERGVPGARACYDYLHGALAEAVMPRFKVSGQARFAIDPPAVVGA